MSENEKKKGIHDAVAMLLESNLKQYADERKLDLTVSTRIYQTIFETLTTVFKSSNIQITNESMNYLAQQYYDSIKINGRHDLDPNIFTQRAKLTNIKTKEITLLAVMMRGTEFIVPLVQEIKRRG